MARPMQHWAARINRTRKDVGLVHGFRSGLEETNAKLLEDMGEPVLYEGLRIAYMVPEKRHHYTPDFPLANGIIVETKGIFSAQDRAKHLFVKAQYPELDIRLVFTSVKQKINPGSKTTVAQWCVTNSIKYAAKVIPEAWVRETGPKRRPEEVIREGPYGYMKKAAS